MIAGRTIRRVGAGAALAIASVAMAAPPELPPPMASESSATSSWRRVGVAQASRGRARLEVDGRALDIEGLPAWPPEVLGREVVVEGARESSREPAGAAAGAASVRLANAHWRLADPERGPWRISVSGGSGDTTTVIFDGTAAEWTYTPVTPARSSSGVYSGGDPARGAWDADAARAVWRAVRVATSTYPESDGARAKGTTRVRLSDPAAQRLWVLPEPAAEAIRRALRAQGATSPPSAGCPPGPAAPLAPSPGDDARSGKEREPRWVSEGWGRCDEEGHAERVQMTSEDRSAFSFQSGVTRTPYGVPEVEPDWVHAHRGELRVLDIREADELLGPLGCVSWADHVPMPQVPNEADAWSREQPIAVICRSGQRSASVACWLAERGFKDVASVRGGMLLWNQLALSRE